MDAASSPIPLLPSLVETYLARCTVEGKSPRTVQAYRETLTRFCRCLVEDGAPLDPDRIRPDHVIASLVRFAAHRPATRHRAFREVRCFCTWLRTAGYTAKTPSGACATCGCRRRSCRRSRRRRSARCLRPATAARRWAAGIGRSWSRFWIPASAAPRRWRPTCRIAGPRPALSFSPPATGASTPGSGSAANGLKQRLRVLGRETGIPRVHVHRFRHTFATWAIAHDARELDVQHPSCAAPRRAQSGIAHDARELDVQHLLGHSSPDMVRRYSATYRSAQAAERHAAFSPGDGMLVGPG